MDATTQLPMNIIPFRVAPPVSGFSFEDLRGLRRWNAGSCRIEIDEAPAFEQLGQFAMIYEGDNPWASWAIAREAGQVVLWDCISLDTLGRFSSVRAALAALPGELEEGWRPLAEVVPFRPAVALTLHQ